MTKVKICGLSTVEAVETAVLAGADYIGFVFAESKRQVSQEQAHELAKLVTGKTKNCWSLCLTKSRGVGASHWSGSLRHRSDSWNV